MVVEVEVEVEVVVVVVGAKGIVYLAAENRMSDHLRRIHGSHRASGKSKLFSTLPFFSKILSPTIQLVGWPNKLFVNPQRALKFKLTYKLTLTQDQDQADEKREQ